MKLPRRSPGTGQGGCRQTGWCTLVHTVKKTPCRGVGRTRPAPDAFESFPDPLRSLQNVLKSDHPFEIALQQHDASGACAHCHRAAVENATPQKIRLLLTVLGLVLLFAGVECAVGFFSHSLALQAEAGHMVADGLALGLALGAAWLTRRAALGTASRQLETIAALANGLGLVAIALGVGWEAVERLQSPPSEILSVPMMVTAGFGLGINSLNAALLHDSSHQDLNLRGAFLHVIADAVSSVGVIVAAIAVWALDWLWADGAVSLLVSVLILVGAVPLIRESSAALLSEWRSPRPGLHGSAGSCSQGTDRGGETS